MEQPANAKEELILDLGWRCQGGMTGSGAGVLGAGARETFWDRNNVILSLARASLRSTAVSKDCDESVGKAKERDS